MKRLTLLLLLLLFVQCQHKKSPFIPEIDPQETISVLPEGAGSIEVNGDTYRARAHEGYFFNHWLYDGHWISSEKTITMSQDSTPALTAEFGQAINILDYNFTASSNGFIYYFLHQMDASDSSYKYILYQYDIGSGEKERLLALPANHSVRYLKASADGAYLSYASFETESVYLFHVSTGQVIDAGPIGFRTTWANLSNRLMAGRNGDLVIYDADSQTATPIASGLCEYEWAGFGTFIDAAWSPDDHYIVFNTCDAGHWIYDAQVDTFQQIFIPENDSLANANRSSMYFWTNNREFIALGHMSDVYRHSLDSPMQPEEIPMENLTFFSLSPDRNRLACSYFSHTFDIALFHVDSNVIQPIVTQCPYGMRKFIQWVDEHHIMFRSAHGIIIMDDTGGNMHPI